MNIPSAKASPVFGTDEESKLLAIENKVCSHGDTVHYAEHPKIFDRCKGSFLYDIKGKAYLDL